MPRREPEREKGLESAANKLPMSKSFDVSRKNRRSPIQIQNSPIMQNIYIIYISYYTRSQNLKFANQNLKLVSYDKKIKNNCSKRKTRKRASSAINTPRSFFCSDQSEPNDSVFTSFFLLNHVVFRLTARSLTQENRGLPEKIKFPREERESAAAATAAKY